MAAVYDSVDGTVLTEGLQSSEYCNEAAISAKQTAKRLDREVILEDNDSTFVVNPDGSMFCVDGVLNSRYYEIIKSIMNCGPLVEEDWLEYIRGKD